MSFKIDNISYRGLISFICGIAFLSFFLGLVVAEIKCFPYPIFKNAFTAAKALKEKYSFMLSHKYGKENYEIYRHLWFKTSRKKSGVIVYNRQKTYPGLTFYTGHDSRAFLMDMDGKIVHEWSKPFEDVWPDPQHILDPVPLNQVYFRMARLFPNGDVIAIYEGINQVPYGGGIIKLDKDSNVLWKVDINAHHDLDIDSEGNVYTLMHEYKTSSRLPIIDDGIAIISPDGHVIDKFSVLDIILNSEYKHLTGDYNNGDMLHTNNIDILDSETAKNFPQFNQGDLLISFAVPSTILVLDGKSRKPQWVFSGMMGRQHDPDFLDLGTVLVFDNLGKGPSAEGRSRLLEIDPKSNKVIWSYSGTTKDMFNTSRRGSQQKLPNGNVLITESMSGRIFEITQDGEIVWNYINTNLQSKSIGVLSKAKRFKGNDLSFLH
jgi:hypothetical protein